MKNRMLIFIALVCFTLLLLELPKQYYKMQDQTLLLDQGSARYKHPVTNTVNDFSLKIESFFNYTSGLPTSGIGYTKELTETEISSVLENITEELQLVAKPYSKSLFSSQNLACVKSRGFTAQVFQRYDESQYVWEVGCLELLSPKNQEPFSRIIYDTETYKIIMLMWVIPINEMEYIAESYIKDWDSTLHYYADISKEINIEEFGYSGIIYPVPIPFEYVETSTLYHDLAELADFFWYESYQNKLIQE